MIAISKRASAAPCKQRNQQPVVGKKKQQQHFDLSHTGADISHNITGVSRKSYEQAIPCALSASICDWCQGLATSESVVCKARHVLRPPHLQAATIKISFRVLYAVLLLGLSV
jgi:hypothetical protein